MIAMPSFQTDFKCDPLSPYHGFRSWVDFFTRPFKPGVRPVACPEDDTIMVNTCESAPFCSAQNAKTRDIFWIKAQPYSIDHNLACDSLAEQFDDATVYQAYLSSIGYHRWHSQVTGTVAKAFACPGKYYAESAGEGFDPAGPDVSQAYFAGITRAVIFIEADNPAIGQSAP